MHADTASSDADAVGCSAPHAHTAERRGAAQDMLEVGMASFVIDEHARHGSVHTYSAACAAGDCNRDLGVETGVSGSGGSGTQRRTASAAQLGDRRDAERQHACGRAEPGLRSTSTAKSLVQSPSNLSFMVCNACNISAVRRRHQARLTGLRPAVPRLPTSTRSDLTVAHSPCRILPSR
jgi:hypothetical protein